MRYQQHELRLSKCLMGLVERMIKREFHQNLRENYTFIKFLCQDGWRSILSRFYLLLLSAGLTWRERPQP